MTKWFLRSAVCTKRKQGGPRVWRRSRTHTLGSRGACWSDHGSRASGTSERPSSASTQLRVLRERAKRARCERVGPGRISALLIARSARAGEQVDPNTPRRAPRPVGGEATAQHKVVRPRSGGPLHAPRDPSVGGPEGICTRPEQAQAPARRSFGFEQVALYGRDRFATRHPERPSANRLGGPAGRIPTGYFADGEQ